MEEALSLSVPLFISPSLFLSCLPTLFSFICFFSFCLQAALFNNFSINSNDFQVAMRGFIFNNEQLTFASTSWACGSIASALPLATLPLCHFATYLLGCCLTAIEITRSLPCRRGKARRGQARLPQIYVNCVTCPNDFFVVARTDLMTSLTTTKDDDAASRLLPFLVKCIII